MKWSGLLNNYRVYHTEVQKWAKKSAKIFPSSSLALTIWTAASPPSSTYYLTFVVNRTLKSHFHNLLFMVSMSVTLEMQRTQESTLQCWPRVQLWEDKAMRPTVILSLRKGHLHNSRSMFTASCITQPPAIILLYVSRHWVVLKFLPSLFKPWL